MRLKRAEVEKALEVARQKLFSELNSKGHWTGELSSSALSTATAVCALAIYNLGSRSHDEELIEKGLRWLAENANPDGGWGDTVKSFSNISTTALCWAAFGAVSGADDRYRTTVEAAAGWLKRITGSLEPDRLARVIIARYGKDRTFSAPILTMCALAGRLGKGKKAWKWVISLPFELAALPHQFFAAARIPVVSYALPALIAIGQAKHFHAASLNPLARGTRALTRQKTLRVLEGIQPESGGFLEATPLTSFVAMSLAASGQKNFVVTQKAIEFLRRSALADGSWPIDTNLATWVTTLAVNALGTEGILYLSADRRNEVMTWLIKQQYRGVHPYTHAAPGGWAWTDLAGGVPDADDTAGALLALANLEAGQDRSNGVELGVRWLLSLQNSDGGIPTFCRGWTHLPFDQSSPDITAHAVRAWEVWFPHLSADLRKSVSRAKKRALGYLLESQRPNGEWIPLWFGNQHHEKEENPIYGTARVTHALVYLTENKDLHVSAAIQRAVRRLISMQDATGGWKIASAKEASVEESSLALEALLEAARNGFVTEGLEEAIEKGMDWLTSSVLEGRWLEPSPIGFYFAKLWYYEKLYPVIFATGALQKALLMALL